MQTSTVSTTIIQSRK